MSDVSGLDSGASAQIGSFIRSRRAAGAICASYEETLRHFDAHCAREFPGASELRQEMVDSWCERRPTESANSCRTRCFPVVSLVRFLRGRDDSHLTEPKLPRREPSTFEPHHFTDQELARFFHECDTWRSPRMPKSAELRNKYTMPVLYRLLYSSGIRTGEARLLRRGSVDLAAGTMLIRGGKGGNERVVALHPQMAAIMARYDDLMEGVCPGRAYFFPNGTDGHLTRNWVSRHFAEMWSRVSDEPATAYHLRHHYATENVNALVERGLSGVGDLEVLSKSMGHSSVETTVASYYSAVPALADVLRELSGGSFEALIPEVL